MSLRRVFLGFLCLLSFCACDKNRQRSAFVQNEDFRLQIGKTVHFSYDPLTCQLSFSRTAREFRCQTDNTSDYYSVIFNTIPTNLNEKVKANIEWTTPTDILRKNNITLEVIRLEDDKIWLWSNTDLTGLNIRILE